MTDTSAAIEKNIHIQFCEKLGIKKVVKCDNYRNS